MIKAKKKKYEKIFPSHKLYTHADNNSNNNYYFEKMKSCFGAYIR